MKEQLISAFFCLRVLLSVVAFYMIIINGYYIAYLTRWKGFGKTLESCVGKFFATRKGIFLCEVLLICGVLSSPLVFKSFENTNIGSFFEKENYRENYYVYLREDKDISKSYKLKADIIRADCDYFLKKIYWDNGGYLTFIHMDDDMWYEDISRSQIYPNKEEYVEDYHDKGYYVTLTTEKVK